MITLTRDIARFFYESQNSQLSDRFCGLGGVQLSNYVQAFFLLFARVRAHTRIYVFLLKWLDMVGQTKISRGKNAVQPHQKWLDIGWTDGWTSIVYLPNRL
jgi:hypothetical protein